MDQRSHSCGSGQSPDDADSLLPQRTGVECRAVKWIVLDLGASKQMDALDIVPARPPGQNSDFRTAMFPLRFKVEAADNRDFSDARLVVDNTGNDFPNPRYNSCRFQFPAITARYVRLTVTRLACWDGQDYGIALGGFAVFDGPQSIATGRLWNVQIRSSPSIGPKSISWTAKLAVALVDSPALDAGMPDTMKKFTVSRVPMLRREFKVTDKVRRATLSVCARGFYEVRINGQRVGDELLTPGFTDYGTRLQYQTHDVTGLLRQGTNALASFARIRMVCRAHEPLRDALHLRLFSTIPRPTRRGTERRHAIYSWAPMANGAALWTGRCAGLICWTAKVMIAAGKWLAGIRPVLTIMPGSRLGRSRATKQPLVWDRCQPVRVIREFQPVAVKEVKPGVYVC